MVQPARAIEIQNVAFSGCNLRTGAIPLVCTLSLTVSGASPILGTFVWGDGTVTQQIQNNGTNNLFSVSHTYTVKGNYTLHANLTDAVGAIWQNSWRVSALAVGYSGAASVSATIEGYGLVAALQRMSADSETFTAYVKNTGSAWIGSMTVTWYGNNWGTVCTTQTNAISSLAVGQWAYATAQSFWSCGEPTSIWVKVTAPGFPSLNGTSPKMTVSWSAGMPAVGLQIRAIQNSLTLPLGGYGLLQYQVTNTGYFSLDFHDTVAQDPLGSFVLMPSDLGNPSHSLFINNTQNPSLAGTLALFQGLGRILLQPGQSVLVNRTVLAVNGGGLTDLHITDTLYPACPTTPGANGVDSDLACGLSMFPPQPASVNLAIALTQTGASILMLTANPLGNGTEQFIGQIVSVGPGSGFLVTGFVFWKSADVTNRSQVAGPTMSSTGTVTVSVTGLKGGTNYSVQFFVQGVGPAVYSNTLAFVTSGFCTGVGCGGVSPPVTPPNFIAAFLTILASASGVPAEIFGYLFGLALIGTAILFLLVVSSSLKVDIPPLLFMGLLWLLLIINVVLFLWPDWIIVLMFVFTGLLLWRELSSSGSEASG